MSSPKVDFDRHARVLDRRLFGVRPAIAAFEWLAWSQEQLVKPDVSIDSPNLYRGPAQIDVLQRRGRTDGCDLAFNDNDTSVIGSEALASRTVAAAVILYC